MLPDLSTVLIFDLDHTLVCPVDRSTDPLLYFQVKLSMPNVLTLHEHGLVVVPRPGVREFLTLLSTKYKIAFWSAGQPEYVNQVVSFLTRDTTLVPEFVWDSTALSNCGLKNYLLLQLMSPEHRYVLIDDLPCHSPHVLAPPFVMQTVKDSTKDGWLSSEEAFSAVHMAALSKIPPAPRIVLNKKPKLFICHGSWSQAADTLLTHKMLRASENKLSFDTA